MNNDSPSDSIMKAIVSKAVKARQPIDGTFELTSRCNLRCGMCYIRTDMNDKAVCASELTAEEWVGLARSATDAGMLFLLITGGEVFARPDFFDIYNPITGMGLQLTVYTNGTLITPAIAEKIAERPPHTLGITLYGATPETYDAVTGSRGSFARCCAGVEALLDAGVQSLEVKTTLTRYNIDELDAMRALADKWKLPIQSAWGLMQRVDGTKSLVDDFKLSPAQGVSLEDNPDAGVTFSDEGDASIVPEEPDDPLFCHAAKCSFTITPAGIMIPCSGLHRFATYPLKSGFQQAWLELQELVTSMPISPTCRNTSCELRSYCPWCPAYAYLETGTYTDPIPYFCEIAKERRNRRQRIK
ncbi:MAG: radical SAM protein [Armatimonadota bacterium]